MGITALGLTEEIGGLPIEAELIDLISEGVVVVLEILGEIAVNEPLVSKVAEVVNGNPMPPIEELWLDTSLDDEEVYSFDDEDWDDDSF